MNKKYLILGVLVLAGGLYWYTTRRKKTTVTTKENTPVAGAAPSVEPVTDSGAGQAMQGGSPTASPYEGKLIHIGDGGTVFLVRNGQRYVINPEDWSTVESMFPIEQVTESQRSGIPDSGVAFSLSMSKSNFANASGKFFDVQSTKWQ